MIEVMTVGTAPCDNVDRINLERKLNDGWKVVRVDGQERYLIYILEK
jgi:hypothetical protein